MTNQEIKEFVDRYLKGQGTAVDLSGKLPEIMSMVLQQIVDMTSGKVDTDTVKAADWMKSHPTVAKYLGSYDVASVADWADYLAWLGNQWATIGSLGHIDVPWGPNEMVSIFAIATSTNAPTFLRNGKVYTMNVTGAQSWTIVEIGGGSGSSDYNELSNKPQIGGVTLSGNKTASQLGLASEFQKSVMPEASASLVGAIWQYMGVTSASFTHGYFYECVSDGQEVPAYSWVETKVQPEKTVSQSISSASTNNEVAGAKAVYDYVQDVVGSINSALDTINGEVI